MHILFVMQTETGTLVSPPVVQDTLPLSAAQLMSPDIDATKKVCDYSNYHCIYHSRGTLYQHYIQIINPEYYSDTWYWTPNWSHIHLI